ncbi:hypothetical protein JW835_06760 [bacterium]|nr:hypothetical protein [bacterium]
MDSSTDTITGLTAVNFSTDNRFSLVDYQGLPEAKEIPVSLYRPGYLLPLIRGIQQSW